MIDETYNLKEIEKNPVYKLAYWLSEVDNDNAPIGWSRYIFIAKCILNKFELKEKGL